ncbi:VPLPA-CTERM sorting domain-containing protein [Parvularcula sp. LCG005]|uniref:VPLPA-CTERM sorting domain-containing protein n=1 Tax=Parvularcula sp. LCG005 TaxID=3078805 RepID=UPI002942DD64|nr:VPLPA-CTERM sorting domain-containing protein [Parvularcula sp. LCG005]WOI54340.1 VPLPA-CTERM sorting domain-containing protein [Parvularcula sp. LCG005]
MKLLTKLASIAAGCVAAASVQMAAQAALVVSSPDASTTLTPTNSITFDNDDMAVGSFTDVGFFTVGDDVTSSFGGIDVRFSNGFAAGVRNMMMSFDVGGTIYNFSVTNNAGVQILDMFPLTLVPGTIVKLTVKGTVFENFGQQANYNIVLAAQPIPVPAAGLFLLTGLAGFAGLRMRKKASV